MITATHRAEHIAAPSSHSGNVLDREIRDVMTPGVVSIVENASLQQVYRAMIAHRVHAILVVGRTQGRPIGWVTARGLLAWIGRDDSLSCARDAVTESPATIEPSATVADGLVAISQAGVSHLLVQHQPDILPEGVVSDLDLVALAHG